MRVLFDKNVPHGVRHFLTEHQVETVDDHGWERISNGELIQTAETTDFEVVITADQNIVYQQNLSGRKIALVVLGSNLWPIVREHAAVIADTVARSKPGGYAFVEMPVPAKRRQNNE
ncbi:MAG TPA: DUF5615 family PIN-like protein [Candidatus Angelobacter sp.]|nr:DUF5615 family PIN-like protein [Candidatus Angelobacter sp.]